MLITQCFVLRTHSTPPATAVAVVDQAEKPVVRLAIKGRVADAWYPLGKLTLEK
jgi:hypothetical protein